MFISSNPRINRLRKRPKKTSSKVKTTRAPFGDSITKILLIPAIADGYNYNMGVVDEFDHLTIQNAGLCHAERGWRQALNHWLLKIALIKLLFISSI